MMDKSDRIRQSERDGRGERERLREAEIRRRDRETKRQNKREKKEDSQQVRD